MYMTRRKATPVTYDTIDDLTEEQLFPSDVIDALFMRQKNGADGNCLFYSVLQSLLPTMSKNHLVSNAAVLRQRVCDFYTTFDENDTYPPDSLQQQIALSMMQDDGHRTDICVDQEYAEMQDIFVLAHLMQLKIVLFHLIPSKMYRVSVVTHHQPKRTVYLRYNGVDHYEAFVKAMRSPERSAPGLRHSISSLVRSLSRKGGKRHRKSRRRTAKTYRIK